MHSLFAVVLLTVHMMLALALIGVVLLQRSEGGMGGLGGGGMSGFMTTRGTANLLTRTTRWLAGAFMVTSMVLAYIAVNADHASKPAVSLKAPVEAPAPPGPEQSGGGTPGSAAPANNTSGTGSTTEQAPATSAPPAPGTTPSAPAVPTNQ
jgi:preprotein translocase subunit SecG